ncbi:2-hydroxy-acid oxidase [Rhodobacterales bacterium 52_120_T64]|nr:2-hydroxy-acid oxidase [Rhodobacterales bacterium 52_120_T64]
MNPTTELELADIIASAKGPLRIVGGDTRQIGHPVDGDALHTSGLSGITLYEPGALTLVAKAGTPLAEIEAVLASENQRLPFEPSDMRGLYGASGQSTIGGVVATNASGPRRIQAGSCRDSVIGVQFVDGQGQILKNGGRVMKNVTGYDLAKLMTGSRGTLGVLTEISFKVLPAPEATATVVIEDQSAEEAVATMSAALGSPYDVNGAAHVGGRTVIRVEGLEGSVNYRAAELVKKLGGTVVDFDWTTVRDLTDFASRDGDIWRFSVKPSDGPKLGAALRGRGALDVQFDWGGGLVWALAPEGANLRAALGDIGGHATLIRGTGQPVFQPESTGIKLLNEGLRMKFDPRNILNTGRMG